MGKNLHLVFVLIVIAACHAAGLAHAAPDIAPPSAPLNEKAADSALPAKTSSGLPIPRFVSLGSAQVFIRTGPALRYPIKYVYRKEGLPVEIVQEFDTWRKIRDLDGDTGWIHQSLLSGNRTAIIKGETGVSLRREPGQDAQILAVLEPSVVAKVEACHAEWCQIDAGGYEGWAERKFLWGIYDAEDFD